MSRMPGKGGRIVRRIKHGLVLAVLCIAAIATAGDRQPFEMYGERMSKVRSIASENSELLGDRVNPVDGALDFDFGNRLRSVAALAPNPASTYVYDGWGRRVRDTTTSSRDTFYGKNGALTYARDQRSAKVYQFIHLNGSQVAEIATPIAGGTATATYIHTDALGTPTVKTSQSKTVIEKTEIEPYGHVLLPNPATDGPGYTGHLLDTATNLNYMQQRYYDPNIGRFLSVDLVTVSSINGANFNRYWYASNNPYKNTDPDGRCDGPSTCRIEWEEKAVMRGEMSQAQKTANDQARGWGAISGLAIVVTRNPSAAFRAYTSVFRREAGHTIPKDRAPHIFRGKEGHMKDTPQNRETLQKIADDPKTTLGTDRHGNTWSSQQNKDGTQTWTQTRNGEIRNGGVNETPKQYNPETGLSRPLRPDKEPR